MNTICQLKRPECHDYPVTMIQKGADYETIAIKARIQPKGLSPVARIHG